MKYFRRRKDAVVLPDNSQRSGSSSIRRTALDFELQYLALARLRIHDDLRIVINPAERLAVLRFERIPVPSKMQPPFTRVYDIERGQSLPPRLVQPLEESPWRRDAPG